MSRAKTYETRTEEILIPIVEDAGVTVYDVEYVKEGSDWYLRVYIDKPEGVNINDCEVVNRALSAKMDELDFIEDAYILEVSSPGLGRALKKERHFEKSIGQEVEVKTYKAIDKEKQFVGILQSYENGVITIETDKKEMKFEKADVASVRLTFDF
jgi:ribosome maturation factor RimP